MESLNFRTNLFFRPPLGSLKLRAYSSLRNHGPSAERVMYVFLFFLLQATFDGKTSGAHSVLALGFTSSSWRRFHPPVHYLSMCPSVRPCIHPSICPSIHLSIHPPKHPPV